jgi:hypothetical protein
MMAAMPARPLRADDRALRADAVSMIAPSGARKGRGIARRTREHFFVTL